MGSAKNVVAAVTMMNTNCDTNTLFHLRRDENGDLLLRKRRMVYNNAGLLQRPLATGPDNDPTWQGPRCVTIYKTSNLFAFILEGRNIEKGEKPLSINGQLYPPLQHISMVIPRGAAEKAGLRKGDRILEVNNVNVEGFGPKRVGDLLRSSGDVLTLTVISVTPQEAERLERCEDLRYTSDCKCSEERSPPISMPDYHVRDHRKYEHSVIFNVHIAGRNLCLYQEFLHKDEKLKKEL